MMKIGFQGWYLLEPTTGIGQHSRGLLQALVKTKKVEVLVVVPAPIKIRGVPDRCIHVLKPKSGFVSTALKKWYWEWMQVPKFFSKHKLDWEYYPYPSPLPAESFHKRAMTVHDLIPWNDSRYEGTGLSKNLKTRYHVQTRRSLLHVDHIFTVSKTICMDLGFPIATVLPNGLPEIPKGLSKKPYQNDCIYLGGYDIRKRVPELIQAFAHDHAAYPERRLLLIGKAHHQSRYYPDLPQYSFVKNLGILTEKELYSALKSAFAFVHFSDSEGFNLPLLQALAVGTPAIVRDLSVNREVSHGAALFWDPSRSGDFSAKLEQLKKPKVRAALVAAGKKAAAHYSWARSAKVFLNILSQHTFKKP